MRTLVIAEPGCTAQGDYATMLRLIDTAAECGADVFKTTWLSSAERLCERRNAWDYQQAYEWHQWPVEWHRDFREWCQKRGLKYACSVNLPRDVSDVAPFVDYLKIPSFAADDYALIGAVRSSLVPAIVSDGMTAGRAFGFRVNVLQCVSAYPAPLAAMNLRCLAPDRRGYDGLSDHSRHLLTGALAVALGAGIVETHYRLDDCDPNNQDYAVAFSPAEFAQYIKNIRDAELILGDGVKKLEPCEVPMLKYRATKMSTLDVIYKMMGDLTVLKKEKN